MKLANQTILIVSNEPWGEIWYSKHNWAFELSKKNQVFFINPPTNWKLSNLWNSKIGVSSYTKSLSIFNYQNILPYTRFSVLYKLNNFLVSKKIKKWMQENNFKDYIFWTFDPYRFSNPKLLSPICSIYFIADKYQTKKEYDLINNVDYFISISVELTKKLPKNNSLILSHGISMSEFDVEEEVEFKDYVLYVGNIDYRIDHELIKKMVLKFKNQQFIFIGQLLNGYDNKYFKEIFLEKNFPNVIYKPPIHFKKLKNYIARAKVCIAPMLLEVNGNNINHHKLLQYMAMGKPILAPQFTDYKKNNLVHTYNNHGEGIERLGDVLNEEENYFIIDKRINFARQFSYENLIEKVEQFLTESTN
jgi:glycosyltransferase involved in cell wall biosynthesis